MINNNDIRYGEEKEVGSNGKKNKSMGHVDFVWVAYVREPGAKKNKEKSP